MKKLIVSLLIISILTYVTACKATGNSETDTASSLNQLGQKAYEIPKNLQKERYTLEDFKHLYSEYSRKNSISSETSNEKTEMSEEDNSGYYTIYEITPREVQEETKCQVFKINNSCETYVVYNSKIFPIGIGFGGFGVVNLTTCDFDGDGEKDLIYTYSFGSGLHRSHIGTFNFSEEKQTRLDIIQMNEDIMLEKVSDNYFKVYSAQVSSIAEFDYTHLKFQKQEHIADVKSKEGKIEVIKIKSKNQDAPPAICPNFCF